ncbi:Cystathionine gamma-synthase [Mycoemilia scoparia]|uniref:Cystathionine gamma-synthase n=1 Tax=Mycoemilia scoparia TaxID=417184 RepID=A0A9W8DTE3_9FUNG|nr:Cystathionine gamma-synthase [Mycoemilia scoparia]
MVCGYPRFFIAIPIKKLSAHIEGKFGMPDESVMLFQNHHAANRCQSFILRHASDKLQSFQVRIVKYEVAPWDNVAATLSGEAQLLNKVPVVLSCVFFPSSAFSVAKQYWQHTGDGISSRLAEHCLRIIRVNEERKLAPAAPSPRFVAAAAAGVSKQRPSYHRLPNNCADSAAVAQRCDSKTPSVEEGESAHIDHDAEIYLEERFGRNINVRYANQAKAAIRRRIAGLLNEEDKTYFKDNVEISRQVCGLEESDVFIVSTGMGAIFHTHRVLLEVLGSDKKSVCFGFPYTDTLKILQKFGPGAYFFGHGEGEDYDKLEELLREKAEKGERVLALFTECPSNPLLKTADLKRLRGLANKYGFVLVIDETIGNFVNSDTLSWADVVVSSLTKVFSGDSNVMGGSIVLNPNQPFYKKIKQEMESQLEDSLWCEDAVFLERNSRNFRERVVKINRNAEALCDMLKTNPLVDAVNYPKYITVAEYEAIKRKTEDAGYGGLFSITFKTPDHAKVFYDNLDCAKGPSLGTNFTLASPYTLLAHFTELDWALKYGVSSHLIRVSVGLEDHEVLMAMFIKALGAIEPE